MVRLSTQFFKFLALVLILSFAGIVTSHAAIVKMSKSGICHPENSPYYSRTKNYTAYQTLQDCLNAGGRLPKGLSDGSSSIALAYSAVGTTQASHKQTTTSKQYGEYRREYFGSGWADIDHDCQNSRMETLIQQSTSPVHFKTSRECQVVSGRWISPFTSEVIHDASAIDIDHVVPLKWAWTHGANQWAQEKREQFANDPANLISVEACLNRQKGAKGPDAWVPPKNQCEYVLRFLRIVKKYKLEESASLSAVRENVCN
jgi:hypothetical protein